MYADLINFEERDKLRIREIIENVKIAPFGYGVVCGCEGNQRIEFYQDEKLCAELTFQHGKSLRWLGGLWESDMRLTKKSAGYLKKWMSEYGNYEFK